MRRVGDVDRDVATRMTTKQEVDEIRENVHEEARDENGRDNMWTADETRCENKNARGYWYGSR